MPRIYAKCASGAEKQRKKKRKAEIVSSMEGSMDAWVKKKKQQSDCTNKPSQQSSLNVSSVVGSSSQPDYYPDKTNQDADAGIDDCISEQHSLSESATLIQTCLSSLEDSGAVFAVATSLANASQNFPNDKFQESGASLIDEDSESTTRTITVSSADAFISDPGLWNSLSQTDRQKLIEAGPSTLPQNFNYPTDQLTNRSFSSLLRYRTLNNGETVVRNWLIYSIAKNAVYCFPCKLLTQSTSKLTTVGYSDWVHVARDLRDHERSGNHFAAMQSYLVRRQQSKCQTTIETLMLK